MHHTDPTHTQARAFALWTQSADQDEPSAHYAEADRRVASNDPPRSDGTPQRATNWAESLDRYESFWRTRGRTPRENTRDRATLPAAERRLGEWARYQRRFEEKLAGYQRIRLDVSDAFDWDPHESNWWKRHDECVRYLRRTGALPRLNHTDPVEFALARWLGRQMRRLQNGTLQRNRGAALAALLVLQPE